DAVALVAPVLPQLVAMELEDRGPGRFQRLAREGRDGGQRGVELGLGDAQLVDGCAVEAGGQLPHGVVATVSDRGQQLTNRTDREVLGDRGARELGKEVAAGAAQI